jgi:quinol monooxygenase YgiN
VVIEKWTSAEALQAHTIAPHMVAYGARTRNMVTSRVFHVLSPA